MRFNADRLAALAGVVNGGKSGVLSEASNRSMHDDPSVADEAEYRLGKGQLAEGEHEDTDEGMHAKMEGAHEDEVEVIKLEGEHEDADEGAHVEEGEHELVEIDEAMLKQEILRMRQERQQTLAENEVRKAVRREIRSIFGDSSSEVYSESSWVYGDNKPTRSKKGQVTMGALGIGFE